MRLGALAALALVIGAFAAVAGQGDRPAVAAAAALGRTPPLVPPMVLSLSDAPAAPAVPGAPRRYEVPRCFNRSLVGVGDSCAYSCLEFAGALRPRPCDRNPPSGSRMRFAHAR